MALGHLLPLEGQSLDLLVPLLHLVLDVFLMALSPQTPLSRALDVLSLFCQSHHLQLDQLVLELVQLYFGVHALYLGPQLAHLVIDFLDVILNFASSAQEGDLLGLVLILYLLELQQDVLFLL